MDQIDENRDGVVKKVDGNVDDVIERLTDEYGDRWKGDLNKAVGDHRQPSGRPTGDYVQERNPK